MQDGFDWVTARAKCTASQLFNSLAKVILANVEAANEAGLSYRCSRDKEDGIGSRIFVQRTYPGGEQAYAPWRAVYLIDGESEIKVFKDRPSESDPIFTAQALFDQDGCCVLKGNVPDGVPKRMNLSEFSRAVFEPFFFPK